MFFDQQTETLHFLKDLHVFISQKFHIIQGLYCLSMQKKTPPVLACLENLKAGLYLHDALTLFPKQFDTIVVMFVRMGELSGRLPQTIRCAIAYLEFKQHMKEKSKKYLLYPLVLLMVLFFVLYFFVNIILPQLQFSSVSFNLVYLNTAYILLNIILFFLCALILFLLLRFLSSWVARKTGGWLFYIPLFGPLYYKLQSAYFLKVLSILLSEKIPATWALDCLQKDIMFSRIRQQYAVCAKALQDGQSIDRALQNLDILKAIPILTQGDMWMNRLDEIAEVQLQSAQERMSTIVRIIEPLVVLLTGGVMVMIILTVFLPLYGQLHVMV